MSFGEELRRERELRKISLREVAQATKINVRYLEALERNDFAHLPGGLFNRGFVRAYCEYIGVDSEAMVNAYLLEVRGQGGGGQAPIGDPRLLRGPAARAAADGCASATHANPRRRRRWLLGLAIAAVILAAGACVTLWVLDERDGSTGPASSRAAPLSEGGDHGGAERNHA
jgi:cytoskeletal protein RodZ